MSEVRALVTGCAGFIGHHLVSALLDREVRVLGVDSLTDYYDPEIKLARLRDLESKEGFQGMQGDLLQMDLVHLTKQVDIIFHLAGQPGVRASWSDGFREYVERNVLATQQLLEASRSADLSRFVFASSSSVYGNATEYPCSETALPKPFSPYGVTKLAGERLCVAYAENFALPTVSLRYFTVYGPGQRPDMAFKRMIDAALGGSPFPLFGDGGARRDFTFVEDVVDATIRAGMAELSPGLVINVAGSETFSVAEVLAEIGEIVGRAVPVERKGAVSGDVTRTGGDARLAHELLGWQPQVSMSEGLRRQVDAQQQRHTE
jgi:nucleoside-diphosphate-sugar epimerase